MCGGVKVVSQEQEGREKKEKTKQKIAGWVLVTVASGGERKKGVERNGFFVFCIYLFFVSG